MIQIPVFNQGDSRWRSKPLGSSSVNMGNAGCFTSAVTMALNNYGHKITPGELCEQLNANNGYDHEGLLRWNVVEQLYPDVVLADSFNTTLHPASGVKVEMEAALQRIINCVALGMPVMITVDVPGVNRPGEPDHIVTLITAPADLKGWTVHDSDGGRVIELKEGSKYGPPEKAVYGARILVGLPQSFPDYSTDRDKAYAAGFGKAAQVMRGRNVQTYSKEIVDSFIGK